MMANFGNIIETVIARHEAIFDRKVGDKHIENCHASLAMTRGDLVLKPLSPHPTTQTLPKGFSLYFILDDWDVF
jgi:hypothetical protein